MAEMEIVEECDQPNSSTYGTAGGLIEMPSTQPLTTSDAQVVAPQQPAAAVNNGGSGVFGHTQWPRYMPKPSEMMINRSPIFYCSTFPLKPGFTARRTLVT